MTASAERRQRSLAELFVAFLKIGVSSFGSSVVQARRLMVETWGWMSAEEFDDTWSMCQALPGPNMVIWAVCVGARHRGAAGAVAAVLGIIGAPVGIVLTLAFLHSVYGNRPEVHALLRGVSPVAAGLILATAIKMAMTRRLRSWMAIFPVLSFLAVVAANLSLLVILGVLLPLSIAAAWARSRTKSR